MQINPLRHVLCAVTALTLLSGEAKAQESLTIRCESAPLVAALNVLSDTGRLPPEVGRFIADNGLQKMEPYKAFDNVYYVGICWAPPGS